MSQSISHQMQVLFATFPPAPGDMAAQIEAYSIALEGHDERDIEAAVRRFLRGEVDGHNQSFPPSAAKLGSVVRLCMNDRLDSGRRDQLRTPQLMPPDIQHTPEQRARVAAMVADLKAKLADKSLRDRRAFTAGDPDGDRGVA